MFIFAIEMSNRQPPKYEFPKTPLQVQQAALKKIIAKNKTLKEHSAGPLPIAKPIVKAFKPAQQVIGFAKVNQ
jgi:hypothetical protein